MSARRSERLNEQFKREIADILRSEVKDPRVGVIVVTGARVSSDLSDAQIFVLLPTDAEARKETLAGLAAATPFVRSQLAQRLSIRKLPQLRFSGDSSLEYANRIEQLLQQTRTTDQADAAPPTDPDDDRAD
jgi:ribosome-binding factor A